jgi:thiol:disulfide interchange protein
VRFLAGPIARFLLTLMAALSFATLAQAAEGESPHIKARLVAESTSVPEGGQVRLVLEHTPADGWHTYWVNAGDAGLPTRISWSLPDGMTAGNPEWPTPKMLPTLGLNSFGYDGKTSAVIVLTNRSGLAAGEALPVTARVNFLVCEAQCIPESLEVSTRLTVGPAKPGPDAGVVARAAAALPRTANIIGTIALNNGLAELGFKAGDAAAHDALSRPQGAYFFPVQEKLLSASAPQTLDMGADGFTLRTRPGAAALPEGPLQGVLSLGDKAYNITLTRANPPAGTYGLGAAPAPELASGGLLVAMGLAFLGGLILNLMPCVFPVLSMKLLALSRAGHDTGLARTESLVYGAGAILSFVALAGLLQLAQGAGASLGWGFQLQSPYVVAALAIVMLLVALNMSGVFNIGSSLQGVGAGAFDQKRPLVSAFLTGVLAVVVAAPCTAPFMATAIGVALAQGGVTGFAIFTALGIGFALPIVLLTFLVTLVPGFAKALPKPGQWMNWLKIGLSLLMYGAAVWLVWVFAQQVQMSGVVLLLLAFAAVIIAVLPIRAIPRTIKVGILGAGLVLAVGAGALPRLDRNAGAPVAAGAADVPHTAFSVQRLTELRADGQPVLVDMTAAWCVTCKVNERLVLQTRDVSDALKATKTVYMVGDWTNQDAEISRYLQLYGRSGVPLYVYYGAGNAEPKVLPQMLDKADIVKMLKDGAK